MSIRCFFITILLSSIRIQTSLGITTHHSKNFRRHIDPRPPSHWEWGLREATHQALLREHYSEPSLHDYIYDAPISGRRNNASPFGDIAVLARGQLYLNQNGFNFVQDQNTYDCDYCSPSVQNQARPIALWTVRRIRHRDLNGHRYEIEYKISFVRGDNFITNSGNYNYAIPGHLFFVTTNTKSFENDQKEIPNDRIGKRHFNQDGIINRGYLPVKTSVNRDRHYLPPHTTESTKHFKPHYYYDPTYHKKIQSSLEQELELYKKLVQSLAMKITGTGQAMSTTGVIPTHPTDFDIFEDVRPLIAPVTIKMTQATTAHADVDLTSEITSNLYAKTTIPMIIPTKPYVPSPTYVVYSQPDPLYTSTATTPKQISRLPTIKHTTITSLRPQTTATFITKTFPTQKIKKTPTTTKYLKQTTKTKKRTTTLATAGNGIFDIFPAQTEAEKHKYKNEKRPETVTEQLPPPEGTPDTKMAYNISSTKIIFSDAPTIEKPIGISGTNQTTKAPKKTKLEKTTQIKKPFMITSKQKTSETTYLTTRTMPTERTMFEKPISKQNKLMMDEVSTKQSISNITDEGKPTTIKIILTVSTSELPETTEPKQETTEIKEMLQTTEPTKQTDMDYHTHMTTTPITTQTEEITSLENNATRLPDEEIITTLKNIPSENTTDTIINLETTTEITENEITEMPTTIVPTIKTEHVSSTRKNIDALDEIFGETVTKKKHLTLKTASKPKNPEVDELFEATLKRSTKSLPESSKGNEAEDKSPKIIFSNFYPASTVIPLNNAVLTTKQNITDETEPPTSQSYSTSVSFEVNKKNKTSIQKGDRNVSLKAKVIEIDIDSQYSIFKAQLPESEVPSNVTRDDQTTKIFDKIAPSVINHARSLDKMDDRKRKRKIFKYRSLRKT